MSIRPLALILCAFVCLGAAAADVATLAAQYEKPALGPVAAIDAPLKISNLELTLHGHIAPLKAGEETIGVFFSGIGKYSYKTNDAAELPLVQFEAKKLDRTAKSAGGAITISGSFSRALIRGGGFALPTGTGSAAGTELASAYEQHLNAFRNVQWDPASHLVLRQRLDAPQSPVAVVELGGSENNAYVLDTIDTKEERFYALIGGTPATAMISDLRGALFPVVISDQPVGRARGAFLHPRYLLVDLDYTLVAGDKGAADLSITETIVPRGSAQSVFRFNLLPGKRVNSGAVRPLLVKAVTDEKGKALPFHFDYGSLLVGLPAQAPADQPLVLKFEIGGDFLIRPDNASFWHLGTEAWFPQPDLNGQFYTIHSIVKLKKPWVAFASGHQVKKWEEGDYNVFENAFDKPLQYAVVHGGKYTVHEQKFDDLTVRVAPYAGINDAQVGQLARLAQTMIKFYEPWLGPFPFKEFNIIEINDLGWGQAPPGMMFITQEAFNPLSTTMNRLYSKGVNQRFAHEIAHQYWGIVVKSGGEDHQWMTEAFAEFSSGVLMKEVTGQRGYDQIVGTWGAEAREGGTFSPVALAHRIYTPADPYAGFEHYVDLTYGKGAYVLAALRKQVGDQKFFSWLRTLQGQFAWRFLTINDAAKILARIDNGTDHQAYFDKYIWGTEMPKMPK